MRRLARENALAAAGAASGVTMLAWLGLYGFGWNDYEVEAKPALDALTSGHVLRFLQLAPAYGGSLLERAPFALLPGLWGGGALAVYRAIAIPCLASAAALGLWLVTRMRASDRSGRAARALALALFVANPLTLEALEVGHPEDLMVGALCIAAVLLAAHGRPLSAGLVAGLAIAGKEWALVALGPLLLALPAGAPRADARREGARPTARGQDRRGGLLGAAICLLGAAAGAGAVLAPFVAAGGDRFLAVTRGAASTSSAIFQPWQIWWFLGHHGPLVRGTFGDVKPGYRTAPGWVGPLSHPSVIAAAALLAAAAWALRRSSVRRTAGAARVPTAQERAQAALLLLALVVLVRCLLDTWDTSYYLLPGVFALAAWEALAAPQRPPAAAWLAALLGWASFAWLPGRVSPDAQSALFLAWALPFAAALALRLYAPARLAAIGHALARALGRAGRLVARVPAAAGREAGLTRSS
jgi:hypothetical protein